MSEANFAEALRLLLRHEGGYSNHHADPGGPTKYGITIGDYRRYIKPEATAADVKAMAIEDAKKIYRARYWDAMRCDELPSGIDYAVFDYGVNSGTARAGKVLRRLLGLGSSSSAVSASVVEAARRKPASGLVSAMCDERLSFLKSLRTWPTFGTGWGRRVAEVRKAALLMARAEPATQTSPQHNRREEAAVAVSIFSTLFAAIAAWMQSAAFWIVASLIIAIIGAAIWWHFKRKQDGEAA